MTTPSDDVLRRCTELPGHEAVRLLMAASLRSRSNVMLGFDVSEDQVTTFDEFVRRRLADEPLQYIEGTVPFGPVELAVDSRVLVPRPETEFMFAAAVSAVAAIGSPVVIVDLCCGSGNLALALAATFPEAMTLAVDISEAATEVAILNSERNAVDIEVLVGDLFDPLPESLLGRVDLLIANPPYIADDEIESLPADVLREPLMALRGGDKGDEIVARIATGAQEWLSPGGLVVCEISEIDSDRYLGHFRNLSGVLHTDLSGKPRFVVARRPEAASVLRVG